MSQNADFLLRFIADMDSSGLLEGASDAVQEMQALGNRMPAIVKAINDRIRAAAVSNARELNRELKKITEQQEKDAEQAAQKAEKRIDELLKKKLSRQKLLAEKDIAGVLRGDQLPANPAARAQFLRDTIQPRLAESFSTIPEKTIRRADELRTKIAAINTEAKQLISSILEEYKAYNKVTEAAEKAEKAEKRRAKSAATEAANATKRANAEAAASQVIKDFGPTTTPTLEERLAARGLSESAPANASVADLRKRRREMRVELNRIQDDYDRAVAALRRAGKAKPSELEGLKNLVAELRSQKTRIRREMADITDAMGGARGGAAGRGRGGFTGIFSTILDYAKFSLVYGGLSQMRSIIARLSSDVIGVSAEFQRLSSSFVAILSSPLLEERASSGQQARLSTEELGIFQQESANLFRLVQVRAIETVATTEEYVQALQAALAVGQKIGLSQEQILDITHRMTLAAGAFGIEFTKVGPSIAQILTGTVRATNQLGRNLGLVTKSQREGLKEAIKTGTVYEFLKARTEAFAQSSKTVENNFLNVIAAIKDIFDVGGSEAIKPFFQFLNSELVKIRDTFFGDSSDSLLRPALQKIINVVQQFFVAIIPNLKKLGREFVETFRQISDSGLDVTDSVNSVISGITSLIGVFNKLMSLGVVDFLLEVNRSLAPVGIVLDGLNKALGTDVDNKLLDELDKISDLSNKLVKTKIDNSDLLQLVETYRQLSSIPVTERSADDLTRMQEIAARLKDVLGQVADSVLDSRRLTTEQLAFLRAKQQQLAGELRAEADQLAVIAAGPEKLAAELAAKREKLLRETAPGAARDRQYEELTKAIDDVGDGYKRLVRETFNLTDEQAKNIVTNERAATALRTLAGEQQAASAAAADRVAQETLSTRELIDTYANGSVEIKHLRAELAQLDPADPNFHKKQAELDAFVAKQRLVNDAVRTGLREEANESNKTIVQVLANRRKEIEANRDLLRSQREVIEAKLRERQLELQDARARLAGESDPTKRAALQEEVDARRAAKGFASRALRAQDNADLRAELESQLKSGEAYVNELTRILSPGKAGDDEEKKKKRKRQRDELNDFLKEMDRQLGLLKRLNDTLRGELQRTVDMRAKMIRELADAGVLTSEEALASENALLAKQSEIFEKLTRAQKLYLQFTESQAIETAKQQQLRDDAKDESGTDNRDRVFDTRLRFLNETVDLLKGGVEEFRRYEEQLTEVATRYAERRIDMRKAELDVIDEFVKSGVEGIKKLAEVEEQLGLLSTASAFDRRQAADQSLRDAERERIIRDLFPILDPQFQREVKSTLEGLLSAGGTGGPLLELQKLYAKFFRGGSAITDPSQAGAFRNSLQDVFRSFIGDESAINGFEQLVARYQLLQSKLSVINDRVQPGTGSEALKLGTEQEAKSILDEIFTKYKIRLDGDTISKMAVIRRLLQSAVVDEKTALASLQALTEIRISEQEALNERLVFEHKLSLDRLDVEREILSFNLQRLDILTDLVERQKELGATPGFIADQRLADLDSERLANLERQLATANRRFATASANLGGDPAANPAVAREQLQAAEEIRSFATAILEVKLRAHDAASGLKAAADSLRGIASVVSGLPDPATGFESGNKGIAGITRLAGVFEGLASIAELLDAGSKRSLFEEAEARVKTAAEALAAAGQSIPDNLRSLLVDYEKAIKESEGLVRDSVVGSAHEFARVVLEATKTFDRVVNRTDYSNEANLPTGSFDGRQAINLDVGVRDGGAAGSGLKATIDAAQATIAEEMTIRATEDIIGEVKNASAGTTIAATVRTQIASLIRSVGGIVSGILQSFGAADAGGRISGIGSAVGAAGGLLGKFKSLTGFAKAIPFVGQAIEIFGSVVSFFGARARQKTREMAENITAGIEELRSQISSNAIGLGAGIRAMRDELINARRQLSGRKGGKEELKQIESEINRDIKQLQERAREVQQNFLKELELLRVPKEFRDIAGQIQALVDKSKEYVDSFENIADAQAAAQNVMEFLELSIKELKDGIEKNMADLQANLRQARDEFERQEDDILQRGRIDPVVSEVENKRRELVELERQFRERQREINAQLAAEKKKLDFVNQRANAERIIADLMDRSAGSLSQAARDMQAAASSLASALGGRAIDDAFSAVRSQSSAAPQQMALTVDVRVNGRQAAPGEVTVGVSQANHLRIANRVTRNPANFTPQILR